MKFKSLIVSSLLLCLGLVSEAQIYLQNFGTTTITAHPYIVAPVTFDPNLSNSSWSNSNSTWTSFAGSTGQAISLSNSGGAPTITLTFDVAPGYNCDITEFNFWRQRSASGAQNWSMTVNGTNVGTGTVPTTGAAIGNTLVSNAVNGLSGTVTVVLSLSGATGAGTFRLDDFTLNGSVYPIGPICTPPATQANGFLSSAINNTTGTVDWTSGSSVNTLVVIHQGTPVNADPVSGITYTANSAYGLGTQIGTGNYVVYDGTGTSVNLTGLVAGTTYYFAIYSYDSNGGSPCYNLSQLPGSFTTTGVTSNCFEIQSILVDACVPGGGTDSCGQEGPNEMVSFQVGASPINVSDISCNWVSLNGWLGICQDGNTAHKVALLNATIQGCGLLLEPVGGVLPANAKVILITSTQFCTFANSFVNLNETMYIIFQCAGNTSGHFSNNTATNPNNPRTFTMSITGSCVGSDAVTYIPANLININGTTGGTTAQQNGSSVVFDAAGNVTYINNGCQAPFIPLSVNAGTDQSGCNSTVYSLSASPIGQYASASWTGGTGTFGTPNSLTTTYTPGVGETGTVNLTVTLTSTCGTTVTDVVSLTINTATTPTITSNVVGGTICNGSSITLTASGGTSYLWNTTAATNTITVSPSASTVYTVTATTTCGSVNQTFSVTINDLPSVTATNTGAYCVGESIQLSATAGLSYAWTGPNTFSSSLPNPSIANATSAMAGTYSLTVTDAATTCQNNTTTTVVVNALPVLVSTVPPVTITQADCGLTNGAISGAIATGANPISYQWISSVGAVIGAAADISSLGSGVYYLAATDGNGCRDSVSFTITTLNGPATPTFATVSPVCEGGSFTLTVTNPILGAIYNWVSAGNPTQSGVDLTSITINSASVTNVGPYTVEVVDAGCGSFGTVSVTLNTKPIPAITGSTSFCFGTSTVLDASSSLPSTGTTYLWYFNNAPISGATSATLTATQAGDYQVLVTNTGCDSLSVETAITINTLPVVNTTTNPVVITNAACGLTNASVIGANATGSQPFNYVWTNGLGTVLVSDTALVNVGAGTYYLVATDVNGCSDSSSVVLSAASAPAVPSFNSTPNVCEGSTFSLSVSNTLLGATYTWTATGLPSQTGVDLTSITVVDANSSNVGTYTVSVTVDNCVETGTVSATFNARPVPEITSNATSFCAGDSLLLNANPQTGVTYAWYYNTSILSGAVNNSFFATQSGNYQLYVNDGTCDSLSVNYPVILNSLPTVTVNNGSACINAPSVQLTATGAQTYTWTTGTTPSTGDIVTVPTSIAGTTGYIVTGTDLNGCVDTTVATVTINSNPVITINGLQNSNITLCNGIDTLLTAAGANTYVWSTTQTINPITYSSTAASTVTVLGVDINGCVDSTTITTTVAPGPSIGSVYGVPTICNGYQSDLSIDSTAGSTYSWVNNLGSVLSTDTFVTITSAGNYSLTVTNSCGSTTNPITIGSASINVSFVADSTLGLAPLNVQFTNTSSGATSYYWLFGNGDTLATTTYNPTADLYQQFTTPGTYSAYLLGTNGLNYCSASMALEIIVLAQEIGIIIPNVFSPNGDLINDYFGVQSYGIKAFSCTIFNRWGTLITELNNLNEKWTPGSNVSEGTYFYLIKATGIDNKDYSREGYMLLVR